jgi:hypothetical protein
MRIIGKRIPTQDICVGYVEGQCVNKIIYFEMTTIKVISQSQQISIESWSC